MISPRDCRICGRSRVSTSNWLDPADGVPEHFKAAVCHEECHGRLHEDPELRKRLAAEVVLERYTDEPLPMS